MDQHYIICGIRDIGFFAAQELHQTQRPFVVIEESSEAIERLRQEIPSLVYLQGEAADEQILNQAGVDKAAAIIACLDDDKDNLYLVLTARELNKKLKIAAKYNHPKTRKKLLNTGASCLVSPHMIGGLRIASELIRPQVVSFLDRMLRSEQDKGLRVEDISVPQDANFVGKTFLELYHHCKVLVISYQNPQTGEFEYNPDPQESIKAGMVLIFIGTADNREALKKLLT